MKKIISILLLISGCSLAAYTPPKEYTFKFTDAQVSILWNVINQSNAPHLQVTEIQNLIQSQYQQQIQKDSINNKK